MSEVRRERCHAGNRVPSLAPATRRQAVMRAGAVKTNIRRYIGYATLVGLMFFLVRALWIQGGASRLGALIAAAGAPLLHRRFHARDE